MPAKPKITKSSNQLSETKLKKEATIIKKEIKKKPKQLIKSKKQNSEKKTSEPIKKRETTNSKRDRELFDSDLVDPTPKKKNASLNGEAKQSTESLLTIDVEGLGAHSSTNFPRGGSKSLDPLEIRDIQKQVELDIAQGNVKSDKDFLLDPAQEPIDQMEIDDSSKSKTAKSLTKFSTSVKSAKFLNYKQISVGTMAIGAIKEIDDLELVVALPNHMTGYVSITDISTEITQMVEAAAADDSNEVSFVDDNNLEGNELARIPDLHQLFHIGQLLQCSVIQVEMVSASGKNTDLATKKRISLTIDPIKINSEMKPAAVVSGMLLPFCVKSMEDHGFVLDIGIEGLSSFLPFKKIPEDRISQIKLHQVLSATVFQVNISSSAVTMSLLPGDMKSPISSHSHLSLTDFLPGSLVKVTVSDSIAKGIAVKFADVFEGTMDWNHIPQNTNSIEKLNEDKKMNELVGKHLKARILFFEPELKLVGWTAVNELVNWGGFHFDDKFLGTIMNNAVVKRVDQHSGISFILSDSLEGFARLSKIDQSQASTDFKKYKVKSKHRCRIIGIDYLTGQAILSLQKSILEQPFLRVQDIVVGSTVEGEILKVDGPEKKEKFLQPGRLLVKLAEGIKAICLGVHLGDVFLSKPEKKFKLGKKIKFKVLSVDPKTKKIYLTQKKSLLSSNLPQIQSYEEAQVGVISHGYICSIKPFGCLVKFYNNIRVLAPLNQTGCSSLTELNEVFKVGQTVKCRVISSNPAECRVLVSFNCQEQKVLIANQIFSLKESSSSPLFSKYDEIQQGQSSPGVIAAVESFGCIIQFDNGICGLAPSSELSDDFVENPSELFKVGDIVQCTAISVNPEEKKLKLSLKKNCQSQKKIATGQKGIHSKDGKCSRAKDIQSWDDLKIGSIISGSIDVICPSWGMYIWISNGPGQENKIQGKVYITDLHDVALEQPLSCFKLHQKVSCYVLFVDADKKHLQLSLRPSLVQQKSLITSNEPSFPLLKSINDVEVNQVYFGYVKNVTDKGCWIALQRDITAFVKITNLSDDYIKDWKSLVPLGKLMEGRVVSVEKEANRIEINCKPSVVHPDKYPLEDNKVNWETLKEGQIIKGEVSKIEKYGVFIKIHRSRLRGLCHISQVSDQRVSELSSLYEVGDAVKAKVLSLDVQKKRICLGMKFSLFKEKDLEEDSDDNDDDDLEEVNEENVIFDSSNNSDSEASEIEE